MLQQLYRTIYEESPLIYFLLSPDNTVLSVNASGASRLGYAQSELIGQPFIKVLPVVDFPRWQEQIEKVGAGDKLPAEKYRFNKIHKTGYSIRFLETVKIIESDGEKYTLVIGEDLTAQTEAENALSEQTELIDLVLDRLQQNEDKYRTVIENLAVAVFKLDRRGIFTMADGAGIEKLGLRPDNVIGKPAFKVFKDNAQIAQNVKRALAGEAFTVITEIGDLFLETSYTPLRGEKGEIKEIIGISVDVTERQLAELALRESEQRYRAFIEQSSEAIWRVEFEVPVPVHFSVEEQINCCFEYGYLAECNDAMARMYGLEKARDLEKVRIDNLLIPTEPANHAYLRKFVESGYRITEAESHEKDAEGNEKFFLNSLLGFVQDGKLVRAWGTQRDITEQKLAEQRLVEALRQMELFVEREALITRISNTIRQSLELEEVFHAITDELGKHLGVDRCILYLFDHSKNQARAAAGNTLENHELDIEAFNIPLPLTTDPFEALRQTDYIVFDEVENVSLIQPLYEGVLRERGVKSMMGVAIRVGDELTGVISFTTTGVHRHWSVTDIALARAVASQAGLAIQQAKLYRQAELTSQREALINRLGTVIRSTLNLSEVLSTATYELGKALDASRVYIRFYNSEQPSADSVPEYEFINSHPQTPAPPPVSYDKPIGQFVLRNKTTLVVNDTGKRESLPEELDEDACLTINARDVKSAIYCPLLVKDSFRGTLCIEQTDQRRIWTEDETRLIEGVAVQLSLGIAQAESYEITRRAKREWETTFDAMSDGIFIFNLNRQLIRVNRAGAAVEHTLPEKLIGKTCCEMLKADINSGGCLVGQALKEKRRITVETVSEQTGRPLLITAEPLVDDEGTLTGVVGTVRDLFELREAETAVREQGILLTRILEGILEPIFAVDPEGKILWCNQVTNEVYGEKNHLKRHHFLEMIHPDDSEFGSKALSQTLEGEPQFFEARFLTGQGEIRYAIFNSVPLTGTDQEIGALWFVRDITDQKRTFEQAAQADKLRALGQLASGVAHDFNNSLTAILGRVQLLSQRSTDSSVKRDLQIIRTAAEDAAATVRRIQTFARQTPTHHFETVDVSALIRDSIEITRTRWQNEAGKRGVTYNIEFSGDDNSFANGSASELREVFVNLIVNALDAMPVGGALKISCANNEEQVCLKFADSGCGMTEEIRERVFEPFFTTKGVHGTGLGLSVSYSIIEAHGGSIEIASEPNKGTSFQIKLPLTKTEKAVAEPQPAQTATPDKFNILVVDDEEFVRDALCEMLKLLEHEVVAAENGQEALEKLKASDFDVVFTDLSMPGMDGWQLAREVRQIKQAAKIVMVTGYGKGVKSESEDKSILIDSIIGKPFKFEELNEALSKIKIEEENESETSYRRQQVFAV